MDWLRKSLMREPRGHRDMFGAILLPPIDQIFRHESTIHSVFKGEIVAETFVGDLPAIVPKISCQPFLTGFHQFVIDYDDPFGEGFVI